MTAAERDPPSAAQIHLPSLMVGVAVMIGGTLYPLIMARASGGADHVLAAMLFWAMSAGFVRGVGFIPKSLAPRWLLSGWGCLAALVLAIGAKLTQ